MHIEFLIEDSSGKTFLETIVPKILAGHEVTWRIHGYRGIGKIPAGLAAHADPAKRIILDQLPRILSGYNKTPYVDAVVVVVDSDNRNCANFTAELSDILCSARYEKERPIQIGDRRSRSMVLW